MALVFQHASIRTVRRVAVPTGLAPLHDTGPRFVEDAACYRPIGSLQALALAIAASVVTPALVWLLV
jgi:hypothetical protein